jgi:hypothetical protein
MFERLKSVSIKERYRFEASIGSNSEWSNYYFQYKKLVDDIVTSIEKGVPVDTVALPLLFLIRHSIELGLKENIITIEKIINAQSVNLKKINKHSIAFLFDEFRSQLKLIIENYTISKKTVDAINDFLEIVEKIKNELHELDKGSYNFRYPVDKEGNQNFTFNKKVNIADILDAYYEIQPFLIFTKTVLYEEGVFGFNE